MPATIDTSEALEMNEGEDKNLDVTPLKFGAGWSDANLIGDLVTSGNVSKLLFNMLESEHATDAEAFMPLSTDNVAQIEFIADGHVRIRLSGALSMGHSGMNRVWELKAKMADGGYHTIRRGLIHIMRSPVGRPA